jgi:hypothetical protein
MRGTDEVRKAAQPRLIPIERPARFELPVNLWTGKTLGLTISQRPPVRAGRVIE